METLFAVLGDPIGHSMSPAMHNNLFSFYQINARYLPFQVKPNDLETAVKGLKAIGAKGFNVTVPHKSAIIPLLDKVDELALRIGAVNTVVNDHGTLIGYNTDGAGFLKGLQVYFPSIAGKKILMIGAGGAARAIYFTLAQHNPKKLDIANRTTDKAINLIKESAFSSFSNALSLVEAEKVIADYDLIIQTTMIGMSPKNHEQPISLLNLKKDVVVCDIIYNPLETQFLQMAREKGALTQNGLEMFVYQGALAFEKWTGIFPDIERMRNNVLQQLGGKLC